MNEEVNIVVNATSGFDFLQAKLFNNLSSSFSDTENLSRGSLAFNASSNVRSNFTQGNEQNNLLLEVNGANDLNYGNTLSDLLTVDSTVANNLIDIKAYPRTNQIIGNTLGASANIEPKLFNQPATVRFELLNGPINPSANKTYVLIHGWNTSARESWAVRTVGNTLQRVAPNANVIAVDWAENGAKDLNYLNSVADMPGVGQDVAEFLRSRNINPRTTQIIGHSLGAHIAGITADVYDRLNPGAIDSVVGLDPAGPNIDRNNLATRLDATDANRVVGIHTDAGSGLIPGLGYYDRLGDADFFVNGGTNQPNGNNHAYAHVLFDQLLNGASFPQSFTIGGNRSFELADINNVSVTGAFNVVTT